MKSNILQLIGSFHQGGSERQAVQLTRLLHQDKTCNVFIAALNDEGVLRGEIEDSGFTKIPEFKLDSFFDLNFIKQVRRCAEFIRVNEIKVVQTHDFYTNIFGMSAAFLARVPVRIAAKRETGGMRSKAQIIIERQSFRASTAIVANSLAVKNYLITEGVSEKKIEVIYNGLDPERLTPKITDRREICEMLGLPGDEKIKFITLVANLRHEVKNQPMFLRGARKVLQKYPDAHFILAGEGELKETLENLAKDLKIEENTHFIGRCAHIPELLSVSDICTLTSLAEGFSNSILEYMAAGKPVIATNVGGASEAIIEGETGFLIVSDDDETLANRLIELLSDTEKAQSFGAKGRKIVEEKFSLNAQLSKTLKLYDSFR